MLKGVGNIKFNIGRLDYQFAASWHGVTGVDGQIHDDLFDLSLVSFYLAERRSQD